MKKLRKTVLIALLIIALLTTAVFAVITFKDTKPSDWYMGTVSKLIERGGINGYPDNTFKPNKEITKAEFVKTVVASLGFKEKLDTSPHWASNYIRKAVTLGIIDIKDFPSNTLDQTISRNDMAKVAVKTLEYNKEKITNDYSKYANQIKDFNSIPGVYKDYVLKAYAEGIINGYPDGTFKGNRGLTRAEASAVIIRILEAEERALPVEPVEPGKANRTTELSEEDIKRLQSYPLNGLFYVEKEKVVREDYVSFKEYYAKEPNDCEAIYRKQLWTPINYPPNDIKGKTIVKWVSSPRLIYKTASFDYGIRGILQKTEGGKIYEADYEIMISNTTDGVYLVDSNYNEDYSGALSEWREVK